MMLFPLLLPELNIASAMSTTPAASSISLSHLWLRLLPPTLTWTDSHLSRGRGLSEWAALVLVVVILVAVVVVAVVIIVSVDVAGAAAVVWQLWLPLYVTRNV